MVDARVFGVTVEREGRWWVFAIPELGAGGQARNLSEVEYEAQGVAAMWLDVKPETVKVHVTVHVPEHAPAEWRAAERDEEEAREVEARAAARRRAVVRELRAQRYSARTLVTCSASRSRGSIRLRRRRGPGPGPAASSRFT